MKFIKNVQTGCNFFLNRGKLVVRNKHFAGKAKGKISGDLREDCN
jgi:hypothetical protein